MENCPRFHTPVILALTRRATLCGLPYNVFVTWLITGCVAFIWIKPVWLTGCLLLGSYVYFSVLCARDAWALDIFFIRLQRLGVCPLPIKKYFGMRTYGGQ